MKDVCNLPGHTCPLVARAPGENAGQSAAGSQESTEWSSCALRRPADSMALQRPKYLSPCLPVSLSPCLHSTKEDPSCEEAFCEWPCFYWRCQWYEPMTKKPT